MQFRSVAVLALASMASALEFVFDTPGFTPAAGDTVTLNWKEAAGPVKITLMSGNPGALDVVEVLATGETDGTFTWIVPDDVVSGNFALEITDGEDTNYSPSFPLVGTAVETPTPTPTPTPSTSSESTTTPTTDSETTTDTSTLSTSTTSSSTSSTATEEETSTGTSDPVNTNSGNRMGSSLALALGAIAAFAFFN